MESQSAGTESRVAGMRYSAEEWDSDQQECNPQKEEQDF
jgi:hypothetical protein